MNFFKSAPIKILNKPAVIPFICWILFIIYELSIVYYSLGKLEQPYVYLIYYPINIGFFYAQIRILDNTFNFKTPKIFAGIIKYFVLLCLYLAVKFTADYILGQQPIKINNPYVYMHSFFPRNLTRGLYFTVLAMFYWSAGHISYYKKQATMAERFHLLVEKEKAELEVQLAKSRNAYLQQKINPHMLFNTLNFVYSSAQKYSDEAANCIWLLAEIMRFSLEETGQDGKIVMECEVEQIENLLTINRYRYNEPLYISVEMEGDFSRFHIIPLILLTLTENIFKHGNLIDETHPATLRLRADDDGKLVFFSRNLKKSKSEHRRSQQLGLQNVRIRLDSSYPDNYSLDIKEPGEFYELTLTLNL